MTSARGEAIALAAKTTANVHTIKGLRIDISFYGSPQTNNFVFGFQKAARAVAFFYFLERAEQT
jgi:hypothetical protein